MTPAKRSIIGTLEDSTTYLMKVMTAKNIRHVPIIDNQKLVGVISVRDGSVLPWRNQKRKPVCYGILFAVLTVLHHSEQTFFLKEPVRRIGLRSGLGYYIK